MDFWFSEQLRNYRLQIIRAFSNFYVKTGAGGASGTEELIKVPCRYGDPTRIAASIVAGNSENKVLPVPFITCLISNFGMSATRRQDPQLVQPAYVNERKYDIEAQQYTNEIGNRYTIDRYMPVPYELTIQVDIWTNNLNMKEQLLEQILVLYNPSIDIQTSVNPIDWTVLTYIEMKDPIIWTSRSIPVGTENPIDVCTLNFFVPIWISPPAKVKRQSLIHQIVTNIVDGHKDPDAMEWTEYEFFSRTITTPGNCTINVKHIAGNDYELQLCGEDGSPVDKELNPTITTSKAHPELVLGSSFSWNGRVCVINHTTLSEAIEDIKSSLIGTDLNCILYNDDSIQFMNSSGGDNAFINVTAGAMESLGLQEAVYKGGNYAWWRLLNLYGTVKPYSSYGSNASQIRLKTVDDIEQVDTDLIGWIDFDPTDQNILIWHGETASMPIPTMSPIDAIVNPVTSGPNINLPAPVIGQRYLITDAPSNESVAWGTIVADPNDVIEFNGINWEISWTSEFTPGVTQYVKNNRTSKIFRYQDGYWEDIIYKKYLQGYWRIAL